MGSGVDQAVINRTCWAVCDAFASLAGSFEVKNYVLAMFFLKSLSDTWLDHLESCETKEDDKPYMKPRGLLVIPAGADFYSLWERRKQLGNGERIDKALRAIEEANGDKLKDTDRTLFQEVAFDSDKLGDECQRNLILCSLMEGFAKPELNFRPSRIKSLNVIGEAFDALLKNFSAIGGKKYGQFYTPPEVTDVVVKLLELQPDDMICDPTCGSGSLLVKCADRLRQREVGGNYKLFGQEASSSTWSIAKMNLLVNGEVDHKIVWGDILKNPRLLDEDGKLMLFDVVASIPPFSMADWGRDELEDDTFNRFERGMPPKSKGDFAFLLHMIETLKPSTGRMGVVVPHGVLFRGLHEGKIRKKLVEENLLDAVIGLPEKLFHWTGIPVAILIFKKRKPDNTVLFIDASRDFKPGKTQNTLSDEGVAKIINAYRARIGVDKFAHLATASEVEKNEYNLFIPQYINTVEDKGGIDLKSVRHERKKLQEKIAVIETTMEKYIEELRCAGKDRKN